MRPFVAVILGAGVAVGLAAVAGTLSGRAYFRPSQPAPPPISEQSDQSALTIDPQHLDFGEVWVDSQFPWQVQLKNAGLETINLNRMSGDCTCLVIGGTPPQLAPGESVPISLTLNLTYVESKSKESWVHDYQQTLTGVTVANGNPKEQTWILRGRVKTAIRPESGSIQLNTVSVRQDGIERSLKIVAAAGIDRIECDAGPNWLGATTRVPNSQNEFVLRIRPRDPLRPRSVSDHILLTPVEASGRTVPARTIPITGELVPDILPSPRAVYFGPVNVGTERAEELRLRSLTGRTFRVRALSYSPSDAGISATPQSADPNEARYSVRIHAPREGEQKAEITFQIEEADGARYPLVVPVNYCGRIVSRKP